MVITDPAELLALERAFACQAHQDRELSRMHGYDATAEARAAMLEAMITRMYQEHFPSAFEGRAERIARLEAEATARMRAKEAR